MHTATTVRVEVAGKSAVIGPTEFVIGRSLYSSLMVDDPSVSRLHASIRLCGGRCLIADLGSRNGTFVNGKQVGRDAVEVGVGDEIRVGTLKVRLVVAKEESRERLSTRPHLISPDDPTEVVKDWPPPDPRLRGAGG
jgi:pSer/pThr/pTyr-binding forkhead associated (FHA) protein